MSIFDRQLKRKRSKFNDFRFWISAGDKAKHANPVFTFKMYAGYNRNS